MINIGGGGGVPQEARMIGKTRGSLDEAQRSRTGQWFTLAQFCVGVDVDCTEEWRWPTEKKRGSDGDQQRVKNSKQRKDEVSLHKGNVRLGTRRHGIRRSPHRSQHSAPGGTRPAGSHTFHTSPDSALRGAARKPGGAMGTAPHASPRGTGPRAAPSPERTHSVWRGREDAR